MGFRSTFITWCLNNVRAIGQRLGCELVVDVSQHDIEIKMAVPDKETRAWDDDMFSFGQLYYRGYANPIKPVVNHKAELADPDTIDVVEGSGETDADENGSEDDSEASESTVEGHVDLIASTRYQQFMRQDLISQLLNPREQWRLIVYAVIALSFLMLINVLVTMAGTGLI